jgi:hypothetical protein
VIRSGFEASVDLEKKSRPSLEGCVRANRRDEMWWSTGVVVVGSCLEETRGFVDGSWAFVASVSAWIA